MIQRREYMFPDWLAQGQGMILGMGDTGIDFDSCYFADPANPIPYTTQSGLQTEQPSGKAYYANATNRKASTLVLLIIIIICHACVSLCWSHGRWFTIGHGAT